MLKPDIGAKIALCFAVVRGNNCGNGSVRAGCKKIQGVKLLPLDRCVFAVLGKTMRFWVLGTFGISLVALATPSAAQSIRTAEPLILAPYESALVQDGSCAAGKILKVTGAIRGLRRKKLCIPLNEVQASLGSVVQ